MKNWLTTVIAVIAALLKVAGYGFWLASVYIAVNWMSVYLYVDKTFGYEHWSNAVFTDMHTLALLGAILWVLVGWTAINIGNELTKSK